VSSTGDRIERSTVFVARSRSSRDESRCSCSTLLRFARTRQRPAARSAATIATNDSGMKLASCRRDALDFAMF
jgi:hypothetical protein